MAHSKNNVLTYGLSGRVGQLVFKQQNGNTIVAKMSRTSTTVSKAQRAIRSTFQQAVSYAKTVISDASLKIAYSAKAKPGQRAFNVAISDFLNAPEIGEIDIISYAGQSGNVVKIAVTDDFGVVAVKVKIEDQAGILVEEDNAIPEADGLHWLYSIMHSGALVTGNIITVFATDRPGNLSTRQKVM